MQQAACGPKVICCVLESKHFASVAYLLVRVGNVSCLEGGHVIRRICKHFRPCLPVFAHVCTVFLVAFRKPLVKFPIRGVPFRLLWLGHFKGSFIGHDLFELNMDNLMFF